MQRFLESDHDVGLDIGAPFRPRFAAAGSSKGRTTTTAAEKRFKEIAEPGAAELKFDAPILAAAPLPSLRSAARRARAPTRWRLKAARLVPARAKLVIFLPLLRVAQHFVGFVDLFKLFFGRFFILGHVRMILARQFAKRGPNLTVGRCFRDPERLVIISELHCHRSSNLVRPPHSRNLSSMRDLGKFIIILGLITTVIGFVLWGGFMPRWLGRLPGDIRIEGKHSAFYFPIVTCIILSIVLSLLFSLFRR